MNTPRITPSSSAAILPFEPKPQKSERFLRLPHSLLQSMEWRLLPNTAHAAFIEIAARYNGRNNGAISYSNKELQRERKMGSATAKRALDTLEKAGLIICHKRGSFDLKTRKGKEASEWFIPALVPRWTPTASTQRNSGSAIDITGSATDTSLVPPQTPDGSATDTNHKVPGSATETLIDKTENSIDYRPSYTSVDKTRTPEEDSQKESRSSYAVRGTFSPRGQEGDTPAVRAMKERLEAARGGNGGWRR